MSETQTPIAGGDLLGRTVGSWVGKEDRYKPRSQAAASHRATAKTFRATQLLCGPCIFAVVVPRKLNSNHVINTSQNRRNLANRNSPPFPSATTAKVAAGNESVGSVPMAAGIVAGIVAGGGGTGRRATQAGVTGAPRVTVQMCSAASTNEAATPSGCAKRWLSIPVARRCVKDICARH